MPNVSLKPFVIVELFSAKSSIYYSDVSDSLTKYGEFVSYDFDINISNNIGVESGQVRVPHNANIPRPIGRGDIAQCTLVNYPFDSFVVEISGSNSSRFSQAFSISSFDGSNIVLVDCIQYNYSFSSVGYVGRVDNLLVDVLSILGTSECRAYAMRPNTYTVQGANYVTPFKIYQNLEQFGVLFQADFTSTNVKPFDIISQAVESVDLNGGSDALRMGSAVIFDGSDYYLEQYVTTKSNTFNTFVEDLRIKPSTSLTVSITDSNFAGMFWVQYKNNADNYIKAGTLVRTRSGIKRPTEITPAEREQSPIVSIPSYLISFNDLLEAGVVNEDDVLTKTQCYNVIRDPRLANVVEVLGADFENISFTIGENDAVQESNYFTGDELLRVFYNGVSKFAVNGVRMVITNINFSPSGRRYSLKSTTTRPESRKEVNNENV